MKKKMLMAAAGMMMGIALLFCGLKNSVMAATITENEAKGIETTKEENDDTEETTEIQSSSLKKKVLQSNPQFSMDVQCGIDGYVLYDTPTQVNIRVSSTENFKGTIRFIPGADDYGYYSYRVGYDKEISLSAGSSNIIQLNPNGVGEGKFIIMILDQYGDVVYSEQDEVNMYYLGEYLTIGVLSDDYMGLSYIDGLSADIGTWSGNTLMCRLSADNFPDAADSLSALNYIIIDNFDTASLSDAQYQALKDWVNNGGVLICALGANYQNVLHIFDDDFISGSLNDISQKEITWAITDDQGEKMSLPDVYAVDFSLTDGYAITGFSEDECYRKDIGNGAVVLLSYSLSQSPVSDYANREVLMSELINHMVSQGIKDDMLGYSYNIYDYYYEIQSMLEDSITEQTNPSPVLFLVIFIFYALLAGPILYFILKKLKKREIIWLLIPGLALVFVGVVYVVGNKYNIKGAFYSTFSVISLDGEVASETTIANVVCPKAGEYTIKLNQDYNTIRVGESYDYYSYYGYSIDSSENLQNTDVNILLSDTMDGTEVTMDNSSVFNSYVYSAKNTKTNTMGTIDHDITIYTDGFEGTVTNNTIYDLTNVVVLYGYYYTVIEELAAGETVDIKKDELFKNAQLYDYYFFEGYYGDTYYYYNEENYNLTISNLMKSVFAGDTVSQGYIWGVTDGYTSEVFVNSDNRGGRAVLMTEFSGDYADTPGITYSYIGNYAAYSSGTYDDYDGEIYDEEVIIDYVLSDDVTVLRNESYDDISYYYGSYSEFSRVYAYNVNTGNYDELFTDSEELSANELANYISDGMISIKYTGMYTYMPVITIGRGAY